jgi:UDP-glucose 4-epimerase
VSSKTRALLVTGASGLIGRQFLELASGELAALETVVALDLRELRAEDRRPGIEYCTGDIRDPEIVETLCRYSIDTVVHLAAVVTPGKESSRELEYSIDVEGTRNVLEACIRAGVRRFLYTSSGAVYGYHPDNPRWLRETDPLRANPEFAYADHKRQVEELLARYRDEHPELEQLVFRLGTTLGEYAANPITAIFDRPLILGVRGSDAPFVLIWNEDVARCLWQGIRDGGSGVYNLTGDGAITLPEIARRLGKPYLAPPAFLLKGVLWLLKTLHLSSRGPEQVEFLRYRPVLCNDKLKSEFGFEPSYTSVECFERYRRVHFGG